MCHLCPGKAQVLEVWSFISLDTKTGFCQLLYIKYNEKTGESWGRWAINWPVYERHIFGYAKVPLN